MCTWIAIYEISVVKGEEWIGNVNPWNGISVIAEGKHTVLKDRMHEMWFMREITSPVPHESKCYRIKRGTLSGMSQEAQPIADHLHTNVMWTAVYWITSIVCNSNRRGGMNWMIYKECETKN